MINRNVLAYARQQGDALELYAPAQGRLSVCAYPQISHPWLHFFIDDARFNAVWANPVRYLKRFQSIRGLVGFDFSLYDDYPTALNIWNRYRSHLLTQWFGEILEVPILPVASWDSHQPEHAALHICPHSAVAVGSYPLKGGNPTGYLAGLSALLDQVQPCGATRLRQSASQPADFAHRASIRFALSANLATEKRRCRHCPVTAWVLP